MNVYYWLIILLDYYSFPRVIYFHSHQTKYGHFYEAKKRIHDIEIYSVEVYFLVSFLIKPNGNK